MMNIKLDYHLLNDISILSQAWRKVNYYTRRDAWFTDYLELDRITLDLESNLQRWRNFNLITSKLENKIEIIDVPKSSSWELNNSTSLYKEENTQKITSVIDEFNTWHPILKNDLVTGDPLTLSTRQLSNVPMDSQIFAMSLLMNLADIVEERQKRILPDALSASNNKVYSYGNRLNCHWESIENIDIPHFKRGSSQTYESYFKNYQLFIQRPEEICKYHYNGLDLNKELYIVSLDFKDFYNSINLDSLYEKLEELIKMNINERNLSTYMEYLKNILQWEYNPNDLKENPQNGLPQGLAASGFFANIFLLNFDEQIGSEINTSRNNSFTIRDYCRYVDDLRFVIEVPKKINDIQKSFSDFINPLLKTYPSLEINKNKTSIIKYADIINNSISTELINKRTLISGAPSVDDLLENISNLKNLLTNTVQPSGEKDTFGLNSIVKKNMNLKEETIKRFVTTDLKKNLKLKDSFSTLSSSQNTSNFSLCHNDNDSTARLLVYEWLKNPSLIYLLKCALELHASSELISPIIRIISLKIEKSNSIKLILSDNNNKATLASEEKYMYYIASQILFYSATQIHVTQHDKYTVSRINSYKETIFCFAKKILEFHTNKNNNIEIPWYTLQGAIFYLISTNNKIPEIDLKNKKLSNYCYFISVYEYKVPDTLDTLSNQKLSIEEFISSLLSFALINQQMNRDDGNFATWFNDLINKINNSNLNSSKLINHLVHLLFIYDKNLFEYVFITRKSCTEDVPTYIKSYEKYFKVSKGNNFKLQNNKELSFLKVISSKINPFIYENPLLLLMSTLLKDKHRKYLENRISLHDITVTCKNWSDINNPKNYYDTDFFKISFKKSDHSQTNNITNLLEEFPFWLQSEYLNRFLIQKISEYVRPSNTEESIPFSNEQISLLSKDIQEEFYKQNSQGRSLYSLGKIIRSSILGDYDYTLSMVSQNNKRGYYTGIVSTIFTRSIGFNISLKALTDKKQPLSPWLLDTIFNMLRWPYAFHTHSRDTSFSLKELAKHISRRIDFQNSIFGDISNLPFYSYTVENMNLMKKNSVRIASVQTMMPFVKDFDSKNPLYWSIEYRNNHRKHLINLCHLIDRHLKTQNVTNDPNMNIDVIIFPELSIHIDDLGILENLSRITDASIFAGLTFMEHPTKDNEIVNQGIWLLNEKSDNEVRITPIYQGKGNMTKLEKEWNISGYRPYQLIIDFKLKDNISWKVSGSICYDSTDLKLATDLTDITDTFIVTALNKDIQTFDTMATALSYHMYQPVIIVNSGEFGGSTVQAPYSGHNKLIAHLHGNKQLGLSIFDISPTDFKDTKPIILPKNRKTPPAEFTGRY